jgi:hypothetical protein
VKDSPLGWRVQLCTGSALALMAVAAVRVDVLNNLEYGRTVSSELATILVLAAIGVVALPTAASILGWSRHIKLTTIVCIMLTVWSAVNAYSTKQGTAILAAQSSQEKYMSAKADEKLARETLKQIKELGEVGELGKLQDLASTATAKACRKPKSDACKLAEVDEKLLTVRLSDAKARNKAQAILAESKEEAKAGPAEASMVATVIAHRIGADAASVARTIALALTGLGIAVTQMVALLGGQAASLIGSALQGRKAGGPAVKKVKPQGPNVIPLHGVKAWLDKATAAGGEMRGGDALKAYRRHAGLAAKDMGSAELRDILTGILGEKVVQRRTSGFVVLGLQLKTAKASHAVVI